MLDKNWHRYEEIFACFHGEQVGWEIICIDHFVTELETNGFFLYLVEFPNIDKYSTDI